MTARTTFRAENLGFAYGLKQASFTLPAAGLVAVTGPNGAGKSTLVGILAGIRAGYSGTCLYAEKEIRQWPRHEFARKVALLPQVTRIEFPFTAEEVVFMGRTPHSSGWFDNPDDAAAVRHAMEVTDSLAFAPRDFRSLSGGECQRVMLASALAQSPEALLLDEPTTFLDLQHQISMYKLLASLSEKILVITVTHDLNLALRYAQRVLLLNQGVLVADGTPLEVFTPATLASVFGVRATIHNDSSYKTSSKTWMEYDA